MYAEITPHHLAALSIRRAADALEQTEADPTTWFFVILDLHRALYCALIAALSGSAGIGAYSDKLRIEWIEWFEKSRDEKRESADRRLRANVRKAAREGGEFIAKADVRATGRHFESERISW
jgi:hypothetical protein